jgi:hypothetical protein
MTAPIAVLRNMLQDRGREQSSGKRQKARGENTREMMYLLRTKRKIR